MKRRRKEVIGKAACAALATLALGGWTAAQEGPLVVGSGPQKPPVVDFYKIKANLEMLYRHESDSISSQGSGNSTFSEDRFEEDFTLSGRGHIVHPNLVDLDLSGTFGLVQDSVSASGDLFNTTAQNEDAYSWDLNATILRKEEAPITLYSRRERQLVEQQFGPSIDSTTTTSGGFIDWNNKTAPMRLEAYHQDQELVSPDGSLNNSLSQNVVTFHGQAAPTKSQMLTWDYTYTNASGTSSSFDSGLPLGASGGITTSQDIHDLSLGHSIDFGSKRQNNLTSSLNYINQSGDIAMERLHWDELLRLKHTDTFETRYQYTLDQQSVSQANFPGLGTVQPEGVSTDQTTQRAQAGFTHMLYQSLTTVGNVGYEQTSVTDGGTDIFFGNLGFDYRKKVPLGTLLANLGLGYSQQANQAQGTTMQVVDVSRSFPSITDEQRIILVVPNINPRSIQITDSTGRLVYRQKDRDAGIPDYEIVPIAGGVQINRILGGQINSDQPVLIDYETNPQSANTVNTTNFSASSRYNIERGPLGGLSVYGRYAQQDQSISSTTAFTPSSFTDVAGGAEYRFWNFTLGAEQEMFDSTIQPYDATRFFARYNNRISRKTTVVLNTTYNIIDYTAPTNHVELLTVNANVQHRFSQELFGSASVLWHDESNDQGTALSGLEEHVELRWRHRQFQIFMQLRNADLKSDVQNSSFQTIFVGVRRDF